MLKPIRYEFTGIRLNNRPGGIEQNESIHFCVDGHRNVTLSVQKLEPARARDYRK